MNNKFYNKTKKEKIITMVSVITAIVVFFVAILAGILIEKNKLKSSTTESESFIEYDNKQFIQDKNRTNILFIGIDDNGDIEEKTNYVNPSFCDFLFLISIDESNKTIYSIQIDRDTMTNIMMYDEYGVYCGKAVHQITYQFNYGGGERVSCSYTVSAVEEYLLGIDIDYYLAITMDAISIINDFVGGETGIPVTIEDDFSSINNWEKGETVNLIGDDAEIFIRSRRSIQNEPTNENRMKRQRVYIESLFNQMKLKSSSLSLTVLNTQLANKMYTNYSLTNAQKLFDNISEYKFNEIGQISGEHKVNSKNMMEFYADEESIKKAVIENLCVVKE